MKIKITLLLLLFVSALQISAQEFNIKNISIEDGLLTNEVHDIHQDKLGNMWFATGLGVIKYDGYNFKDYSSKDGLTHNVVFQLKDFNNVLWINTYLGGLCYFKNDSIIPYEYNELLLKDIRTSYILDFTVEEDGLWYSLSSNGGIYHISNKGNLTIIDNQSEVTAFVQNFKNSSLTGFFDRTYYSESIKFHRIDSLSFVSFPKKESSNFTKFISSNDLYSFSNFLFKTNDGVIQSKIRLPYDIISHYKDKDDNIWAGTLSNGVLFFKDGELQSTYIQSLSYVSISDIFQDRQGNIWFSSIESGLFLLKNLNSTKYLTSEKISAIEYIDDVIFCGTQKGNLYKIHQNNTSLLYQKKGGSLKDIFVVDENNIIANSWRINFKNGKQEKLDHLKSGELYLNYNNQLVSAYYGIQIYENKKLLFDSKASSPPFKEKVKKLLSGHNDTILVLANSGLYYYANNKIKKVILDSEINEIEITDIMQFNNSLLIATSNNGVYITNQNKISQHLTLENGLKSDNCFSLVEKTKNTFCIGSNKGIDIVTINDNNYTFRNLNRNNMLSTNDVNIVKINKEKIIVGTDKGLEIINDNDIATPYIFNSLIIQSVEINNIKHDSIDNLTLNFNQNNIKITFVSPHYSNEISYRYRLKGTDNSWSITKQDYVRYNRLSPGDYAFQIQAVVNKKYDDIVEVNFIIKPHFTRTWWFITLIVLILIWIIYLLFMDMRIKEKYKRESISSKQTALRSQMNPHFLFNALNSIQTFILRNEKELSVKYLNKFSSLIRRVLDNSQHNFITIEEDINALVDYIELEKVRFEGKFNYEIKITKDIDVNYFQIPPLILQPIIENSIWHGLIHKKIGVGMIVISFNMEDEDIICIIEDNGVGRKKSSEFENIKNHKSIGISITKERLRIINKRNKNKITLFIEDVDSEIEETGTRVIIRFPKRT